MPLNDAAHNIALDAIGAQAGWLSAHTADPGATGLNEVVGGAYGRQPISWNPAAAANLDSSNQPVLEIPGGTTITHLGQWDQETGGNFLGSWDITDESFGADGQYTATDLDWNMVPQ